MINKKLIYFLIYLLILLVFVPANFTFAEEAKKDHPIANKPIEPNIKVINLSGIENVIREKDRKLTIINLWATWCVPCIEELPHFGNIYQNYPKDSLGIYLINIEGIEAEKKTVEPFLKKKPLPCPVYILEKGTPEEIEKVLMTEISGALPVTLIYSGGKLIKKFEEAITEDNLKEILTNYGIKPIEKN